MDSKSISIFVYSDSSFANKSHYSTKLGFIILLLDDSVYSNVLQFCSYKPKRFLRSVLGRETYAFADGFDQAYVIRHDLSKMLRKKLPLTILTDSKSLFQFITSSLTVTSEKRLMVDVLETKQADDNGEISDVVWIPSDHNLADGLKNGDMSGDGGFLDTDPLKTPIAQWVVRGEVVAHDALDAGGRESGLIEHNLRSGLTTDDVYLWEKIFCQTFFGTRSSFQRKKGLVMLRTVFTTVDAIT